MQRGPGQMAGAQGSLGGRLGKAQKNPSFLAE